jgi:hypothetical protein
VGDIEGKHALLASHNCGFPKSLTYKEPHIIMMQIYNTRRNIKLIELDIAKFQTKF